MDTQPDVKGHLTKFDIRLILDTSNAIAYKKVMKEMRNNIPELLARKARRQDRKRIPLKSAAAEMGVSYYTLNAIVNNSIREYPVDVLKALCDYLECNVGDLLSYEEIPTA